MAMNRVQFQKGLSLPDFLQRFGTEEQCATALELARWPDGFHCPHCEGTRHSVLKGGSRKTFQCSHCRHQTSLIAGTLFQGTRLPLTLWFMAIYLISQAKTGVSALALSRQLGVSYPTAWRIHHKLMQSMLEREALYTLQGSVQADDAYLGGERSGGKPGRGSENKVPFVAAVSVDEQEHPIYARFTVIKGFTGPAIADWARTTLDKKCQVLTDGLPFKIKALSGCVRPFLRARNISPASDVAQKGFDQAIDGELIRKAAFADEAAIATFGVGRNMVASIRHWALACGVMREADQEFRISELAREILQDGGLDPYAEHPTTAWLAHWQLAGRCYRSTTWYWLMP